MSLLFDLTTSATLLGKLQDYQNGSAWQQFFASYVPMLRAWASRYDLSRTDVEELVSVVLVKLAEAMKSFAYDPDQGFRKWLKTVVNNSLRNYFRTHRRRRPDWAAGGRDPVDPVLDPTSELVEEMNTPLEQKLQQLQRAMATIRERQQGKQSWEAFRLTTLEGKTAKEAALLLDKSVVAVSQAKYRILKELREELTHLESAANQP